MYDECQYAMSRLTGTVVRLGTKAVYVDHIGDKMQCQLTSVLRGESLDEVPLKALSLKSPPLGYTNYDGTCYYLARRPMRRDWRQGLRKGNVIDLLTDAFVGAKVIATCVEGVYPTTKEAQRYLATMREVAVSRDFSLSKGKTCTHINYKWYGVVGVLSKDGEPKVKKNFKFLSKTLKGVFNANS